MNGTIVAFATSILPRKGWGYIRSGTIEYFFHVSNSAPEFKPALGLEVEFTVAPPFKMGQRDQAINVRPVGAV